MAEHHRHDDRIIGVVAWQWIECEQEHRLPGVLFIDDDAVSGFFAINVGGLPGPVGTLWLVSIIFVATLH